jgi:putative phosphoribosyl transferase
MKAFGFDDESKKARRFPDPRSAGRELAAELGMWAGREDAIVLALARGGVPVASEVAKRLGLPLDVVIIQRVLLPRGPDAPVCALNVGGTLFLDEELRARPEAPSSALELYVADALDALERSARACRGARPVVALAHKTVILVDNGVRTGSTVCAAVRAVRAAGPARVVVAVPVAARESRAGVEADADELVCLAFPEPFGHVGVWYEKFERPGDESIREALEEVGRGGV